MSAALLVEVDGGGVRGGLRASPHFYNTPEEIDRLIAGVGRYLKTGV